MAFGPMSSRSLQEVLRLEANSTDMPFRLRDASFNGGRGLNPEMTVVLLSEDQGHWSCLRTLLEKAALQGPGVHDARIAALCIQHGVSEIWTADRDFARFAGLRAINPLVA